MAEWMFGLLEVVAVCVIAVGVGLLVGAFAGAQAGVGAGMGTFGVLGLFLLWVAQLPPAGERGDG